MAITELQSRADKKGGGRIARLKVVHFYRYVLVKTGTTDLQQYRYNMLVPVQLFWQELAIF